MKREFIEQLKAKCLQAENVKCSVRALSKYVALREKTGRPKPVKLNYIDHESPYHFHTMRIGESKILKDVEEPERLSLLMTCNLYSNKHHVKFMALRIKNTNDVELVRLM